jgi:hypothetical protein
MKGTDCESYNHESNESSLFHRLYVGRSFNFFESSCSLSSSGGRAKLPLIDRSCQRNAAKEMPKEENNINDSELDDDVLIFD